MRHMTGQHEGAAIDEAMLTVLRGIDRAVCTGDSCRCIRRIGTRQCHRCNESRPLRPLVLGDIIPGGRGVPLRTQPTQPPTQQDNGANAMRTVEGDIVLPVGFSERVRRVPPNTLVHIPVPQRLRMAKIATSCWEGMAAGLPGWCKLEEARSKLLLAAIPDGAHVPKELAT
eukprot:11176207-Karenia_brevis.AAC.1